METPSNTLITIGNIPGTPMPQAPGPWPRMPFC